jgi:hypothetical protein
MTTVAIAPSLRRFCGGREELRGEGATVLEVLRDASAEYPALRHRVLRNETEISSRIFVYRDDGSVIADNRETAPAPEGSGLRLYLLIGGG